MITALRAEFMKTKRRFLWLLPFCVVFFEFLWTITNSYLRKPEIAAEGCYTLLYQFPLYNTIFMPLTLAAMASRLCDAENKGNTYKLLCTMQQKKIIFDAKLLMGIFYVLIFTALEAGVIPLLANLLPFTQKLPVRHYLAFLAVFFLVSLVLFLLQQILSLLIPNQLIPLFIGLLGSLVGVFFAFFPMGSLAGLVPWGYYMVGMTLSSVYEESTRSMFIEEAPFAWGWFAAFLAASVLLYLAGKHLFLKKEV